MKKIKFIEKNIGKLQEFSMNNLDKVVGGIDFKCTAGGSLTCSPFTGSCLVVTIRTNGDKYACNPDGALKKA